MQSPKYAMRISKHAAARVFLYDMSFQEGKMQEGTTYNVVHNNALHGFDEPIAVTFESHSFGFQGINSTLHSV